MHEQGIRWPFSLQLDGADYSSYEGLSAPAVWDALPDAAKWQIFTLIFAFESFSECTARVEPGTKHYMRGGQPGKFPKFTTATVESFNTPDKEVFFYYPFLLAYLPLNLFDPFGFTKKLTPEQKAIKLNAEINNGRLAMLGFFGFVVQSKIPGSIPFLNGMIKPYDGDFMAPFAPAHTWF